MKKVACPVDECPKAGDVFVCVNAPKCKTTATYLKDCECTDCACVSVGCCCGEPLKKVN